jgi:DNA repair protein RadC
MTKQRTAPSTRRDTAHHQDQTNTLRRSGVVHFTDRVERSGPLLHELTMQHRLKRDAEGRPLHLGPVVTNPYQAAKLLAHLLAFEAAEVFGVLCLTARSRVIGWYEVSRGSVNSVSVSPRDVFRAAMLSNAASLILAHNHPSGESQPSDDDCRVTKRMVEGANLLGIAILDHIIIGDHEYASVRAVPPLSQHANQVYGSVHENGDPTPPWEDLVCTSGRWTVDPIEDFKWSPLTTEPPPCEGGYS